YMHGLFGSTPFVRAVRLGFVSACACLLNYYVANPVPRGAALKEKKKIYISFVRLSSSCMLYYMMESTANLVPNALFHFELKVILTFLGINRVNKRKPEQLQANVKTHGTIFGHTGTSAQNGNSSHLATSMKLLKVLA
ncbi:hypothetical protein ACJX0J_020296, partial [Zea mays]